MICRNLWVGIAALVECLPSMREALEESAAVHQLVVVVGTCNSCTWEVEAGGTEVQGQPWLQFEAILGYMRPWTKKNNLVV